MKIAIIAPSPVPFGVGGAEKLWWGMLDYFNKHTTNQCELIKISIKENSFWDLIDAYHKFYTLDVSGFDLVITGKYPAWMIQHKNHHLYMLHCLRGLYDTCSFTDISLDHLRHNNKLAPVLECLEDKTASPKTALDNLFALLSDLKQDRSIPPDVYGFPGPFIREIIHFLDKKAMAGVKRFSAISNTVAGRKSYFPHGVPVRVVYPPSVLTGFQNTSYNYFFTASRLDNSKRIHMIVEAYLKTKTTLPLKIAGTGPLSETLIRLAQNDPRVEFLGFVSDQDLLGYYSNAFAVIFIPYDEDYGLITVEAMMCEKPVITVNDSGGVLEFVTHGVTGLVCPPTVKNLAAQLDYLSQNPDLCRKMGKQARERVKGITWKQSMEDLIQEQGVKETIPKKPAVKKIIFVTTYPVYPPRGGGQNRIFYLARELAKSMIVEIVCLVPETQAQTCREIAPDLYEIRIPKTREHGKKEWELEEKAGIPVTDIAFLSLAEKTPGFLEAVKASARDADFAVSAHPYTFDLLKNHVSIPVIHDSHNVEYDLKKQMLSKSDVKNKLLDMLFNAEKKACESAVFTTVCSMEDACAMEQLYEFDPSKAVLVPNGVNLETVCFTLPGERISLKKSLGINQKILLFMGSWHQPNIDAVEEIFKLAAKTPEYCYIIVGSVGGYFATRAKPANLGFAGVVDDREKALYLAVADIALNPMGTGSGTNLKMLDYMAAGLPVISTRVGTRGLDIPLGCVAVCEIEEFDKYIKNIKDFVNTEKSRAHVQEKFSWEVIAAQFQKALQTWGCNL